MSSVGRNVAVLALDLGTTMGWAYMSGPGVVLSGSENLHKSNRDSSGMRYLRFMRFLDELHERDPIEHIAYEDVRRHEGTQAAHVYGGFMSHLQAWCERNQVPCEAYGVAEIKKAWTGKGNASKNAMIQGAIDRGFRVKDDNQADALAILHMMTGETL
jgi:Holliday junction resolvasome RuvABC endonuclease subunit